MKITNKEINSLGLKNVGAGRYVDKQGNYYLRSQLRSLLEDSEENAPKLNIKDSQKENSKSLSALINACSLIDFKEKEVGVIDSYINGGSEAIKGYLSGQSNSDPQLESDIKDIDKIMSKLKLPTDTVVFIGVGGESRPPSIKPGQKFKSSSYISASLSIEEIMAEFPQGEITVFRYSYKKGGNLIFPMGISKENFPTYELILPRELQISVIDGPKIESIGESKVYTFNCE